MTCSLYVRILNQGPSGTSTVRIIDFNCARRGLTGKLSRKSSLCSALGQVLTTGRVQDRIGM